MIQEEYKIWVLIAEAYGYVDQFRPYPGTKKGKQNNSSAKWELGEKVVLQIQSQVYGLSPTFSFDIFMDKYFTSFCLLTHVGVNNIRARGALNKKRLHKSTITGDKQLPKKRTRPLWTAHIKQKSSEDFIFQFIGLSVASMIQNSKIYVLISWDGCNSNLCLLV